MEQKRETTAERINFTSEDAKKLAKQERRRQAARNRRKTLREIMSDHGMTRVKGNLGGTYWE